VRIAERCFDTTVAELLRSLICAAAIAAAAAASQSVGDAG